MVSCIKNNILTKIRKPHNILIFSSIMSIMIYNIKKKDSDEFEGWCGPQCG